MRSPRDSLGSRPDQSLAAAPRFSRTLGPIEPFLSHHGMLPREDADRYAGIGSRPSRQEEERQGHAAVDDVRSRDIVWPRRQRAD